MKKLLSSLALIGLCVSASAQGPIYSGGFIVKDSKGNNISGDDGVVVVAGELHTPGVFVPSYIGAGQLLATAQFSGAMGPVTIGSGLTYTPGTATLAANGAQGVTLASGGNLGSVPGLVYDDFSQYTGSSPTINKGINWGGNAVVTGTFSIVTNAVDSLGGGNANALAMHGSGDFARPLPWGAKWKFMRIGILWRINAAANTTADFGLGLCSGTANPFLSATCANAITYYTRVGNGNVWTFNAGTDYAYFTPGFAGAATKHNTTLTGDSSGTGTFNWATASSSTARGAIVISIDRSNLGNTANTYHVIAKSCQYIPTLANQGDSSTALLYAEMINATTGSLMQGGGTATVTLAGFSETNGALDTLDIFWTHATTNVEIDAIIVFRMF